MRTKSIYDIPLRVTFYARVSSESDEQLNSLDNQISYYENFIKKNKVWTFVPGYIDEGLSGISTKKRKHFNEMIADAKDGMFDLIITKEISRFARNTLDSLQHTRELLNCGVGVFFQNDNINTLDEDAERGMRACDEYLRSILHSIDMKSGKVNDAGFLGGFPPQHTNPACIGKPVT
jgi:DNA invertase Pin-like site-specific DNA recombinase